MAEKPVLHIHAGLPKTGTSALQRFLALNAPRLAERGLLIPETGQAETGSHHPLMFDLAGLNPLVRSVALHDLEAEIRESGAPAALVSSEFFYGVVRWGMAGRALRRLRRRGIEIRLHLAVRPQADFAVSAFPEFLRNMVVGLRFPEFVERNFMTYMADYRVPAALMGQAAGAVPTWLAYTGASRREGVWWDLLASCGLTLDAAERAGFEQPGEVNRSLGPIGVSALTQALLRIEREGMVARWGHRKAVRSALLFATHAVRPETARYNPLGRAPRREIWERCAEANDALARAAWGRGWDEVFEEERAAFPPRTIFRRPDASAEDGAHHDWMARHFYRTAKRKIAAVEANAREAGLFRRLRRAFGRPVDWMADRVMKAMIQGG